MQIPLELTFRGLAPSSAIEDRVREKAAKLDAIYDGIVRCRVTVEATNHRHQKGTLYHVLIDLTVPNREIVVSRDPQQNQAHEDAYVAIRDAFDAAKRQLEDYVRVRRGRTKHHEPEPHGRVVRLFPEGDYGFITTSDGREIYFHRNSVLNDGFDRLEVGTEVRFAEEMGEQGPQASTVTPVGRQHP